MPHAQALVLPGRLSFSCVGEQLGFDQVSVQGCLGWKSWRSRKLGSQGWWTGAGAGGHTAPHLCVQEPARCSCRHRKLLAAGCLQRVCSLYGGEPSTPRVKQAEVLSQASAYCWDSSHFLTGTQSSLDGKREKNGRRGEEERKKEKEAEEENSVSRASLCLSAML